MSRLEKLEELSRAPSPFGAELTRIRGMVRRTPEGVQKQRLELLAAQLENGAPAPMVARQIEIMADDANG